MHIASKIILLIGAIVFIVSAIGMAAGIGGAIGASESRTYLEDESSGTFTVNENESWAIDVYLIHPVDCESVEITVVDSFGTDVIEDNWNYGCYDNEMTYEPGERELYANLIHEKAGMEYTLNSNVDVDVTGSYCDQECIDSAIGGGLAAFGGLMGICCAVPIIILGIILAFTLDDNKTSSTMQSGQVAYQTPVTGQIPTGQVVYQTPITGQAPVTQTFNQTPVGQVIQPSAVPVTPITPPITQQPPVEQATQAAVPVTPITPPTVQQPSTEQATQPEQAAWWGDEPQQ